MLIRSQPLHDSMQDAQRTEGPCRFSLSAPEPQPVLGGACWCPPQVFYSTLSLREHAELSAHLECGGTIKEKRHEWLGDSHSQCHIQSVSPILEGLGDDAKGWMRGPGVNLGASMLEG